MLGVWRGLHSSFSRGYHLPEIGLGGILFPEATRKGKTPAGHPECRLVYVQPSCRITSDGHQNEGKVWNRGNTTGNFGPQEAGADAAYRVSERLVPGTS